MTEPASLPDRRRTRNRTSARAERDDTVYDPRSALVTTDGPVPQAQHAVKMTIPSPPPAPAPPTERERADEVELLRSRVEAQAERLAFLEHGMRHLLRRVFPSGLPTTTEGP